MKTAGSSETSVMSTWLHDVISEKRVIFIVTSYLKSHYILDPVRPKNELNSTIKLDVHYIYIYRERERERERER
jgi:hypothetical protein